MSIAAIQRKDFFLTNKNGAGQDESLLCYLFCLM